MQQYRLIGFYSDSLAPYDSTCDGPDVDQAVATLRHALGWREKKHLMVVAVLDSQGLNLHCAETAVSLNDWSEK